MSHERLTSEENGKSPEVADERGAGTLITDNVSELMADDSQRHGPESEAFLAHDTNAKDSVNMSHLINLTIGLGGLQVVWSVILSRGSPFLVSLGLSKSLTALVWIAAPLCGSVVQPIVGSLSDRTSSRWGRRRPFIIAGNLGIVLSVLLLAWSQEIVHRIVALFGGDIKAHGSQTLVLVSATLWTYALNIAIQPVQFGIRSLIVENCPSHQQPQASTYASVMTGFGNIFGYLFGFGIVPAMSNSKITTFQMLCLFASVCLTVTVLISCITISEKTFTSNIVRKTETRGIWTMLKDLHRTYRRMPSRIRKVCHVQFLAWIGWFPFLFYSTTYVAETCMGKMQAHIVEADARPKSDKPISPEAIRRGTYANFLFAVVAFIYNMLLPRMLKIISNEIPHKAGPRHATSSIVQAWTYSHGFFALLMFATIVVSSQMGATVIVALAGLSWAITLFAPFAIISTELAAEQALQQDLRSSPDESSFPRAINADSQTGAVIGLHNIAISAPQILAALVCSVIYAIANALHSQDGTGWVLRAGGVAALGATYLCRQFES